MADAFDSLKAALADRYAIEREIGRGGMATVYLARDVKHQRLVAVKVLRPELAAALGAERFLREIKITANLNHPHILPLLDSGFAEEQSTAEDPAALPPCRPSVFLYYVMPYVEGESLRDRLSREKQLPIADALKITNEVADALGSAHRHNCIHRDIKPENILLQEGHAVVADFGVARAIEQAEETRLTETGIAIGTPAYLSPEQAAGERDLDGRSDIYALGCVLYEMLAGQPPFTGPTIESIVHQHLAAEPQSVTMMRPAVPSEVDAAVSKALAKSPADRFVLAQHFVEALSVERVSAAARKKPATRGLPLRIALFGVTTVLVSVVVAVGVLLSRGGPEGPPKLAVLPFENLGPPEDEYFADGMTEEITSRLARVSGLIVIARTSAIQYKDTEKSARQIADELGVDYLLEGTVRWSKPTSGGSRVRVSPQLIRGSDEAHVWAEPFEETFTEVFALQANIAEQVAAGMNVVLLPEETEAIESRPTENMAAYDVYLRGLEYYDRGFGGQNWEVQLLALEMFDSAAVLDPDFLLAHVMRFFAHARLDAADYDLNVQPHMVGAPRLALAKHALDEAVRLDPEHVEVHKALATYYGWTGDMQQIAEHVEAVIHRQPNDPWSLLRLASLQLRRGERDSAEVLILRAGELDPRSVSTAWTISRYYRSNRRYEDALHYQDRIVSLAPDLAQSYHWKSYLHLLMGDSAAAHQTLQLGAVRVGLVDMIVDIAHASTGHVLLRIFDDYGAAMRRLSQDAFGGDTASYLLAKPSAFHASPDLAKPYFDSLAVFVEKMIEVSTEDLSRYRSVLAQADAANGRMEAASRQAETARQWFEENPNVYLIDRLFLAEAYVMIEALDAAVDELRIYVSSQWFSPAMLRFDPFWDPLRHHPGFQELVAGGN